MYSFNNNRFLDRIKLSHVLPHDSLYLLLEILFKIVAELLYLIKEAGTLFIV